MKIILKAREKHIKILTVVVVVCLGNLLMHWDCEIFTFVCRWNSTQLALYFCLEKLQRNLLGENETKICEEFLWKLNYNPENEKNFLLSLPTLPHSLFLRLQRSVKVAKRNGERLFNELRTVMNRFIYFTFNFISLIFNRKYFVDGATGKRGGGGRTEHK